MHVPHIALYCLFLGALGLSVWFIEKTVRELTDRKKRDDLPKAKNEAERWLVSGLRMVKTLDRVGSLINLSAVALMSLLLLLFLLLLTLQDLGLGKWGF
jgi:hypothetical protein